jgi:hypothetical protein
MCMPAPASVIDVGLLRAGGGSGDGCSSTYKRSRHCIRVRQVHHCKALGRAARQRLRATVVGAAAKHSARTPVPPPLSRVAASACLPIHSRSPLWNTSSSGGIRAGRSAGAVSSSANRTGSLCSSSLRHLKNEYSPIPRSRQNGRAFASPAVPQFPRNARGRP